VRASPYVAAGAVKRLVSACESSQAFYQSILPPAGFLAFPVANALLSLLERVPIGWNHPIEKNSLQINKLEHVLIEKVDRLFRNML
jgi:hypothetical protein